MPLAVTSSDIRKNLCTSSIVMMEPTQDREGEDLAAFGIWWHKKVFQFCPRGLAGRAGLIYFWIVRLQTRRPSLSNSPRILSAPHSRLSLAISLIKATVSGDILGLVEAALDLYFQYS